MIAHRIDDASTVLAADRELLDLPNSLRALCGTHISRLDVRVLRRRRQHVGASCSAVIAALVMPSAGNAELRLPLALVPGAEPGFEIAIGDVKAARKVTSC